MSRPQEGGGRQQRRFQDHHEIFCIFLAASICCLLMGATGAAAAEYTVNSTGDQVDENPGSAGCKTAVATCTLRAAIEESNASIGVNDAIEFGFSFDGQIGDAIELSTAPPMIVAFGTTGLPNALRGVLVGSAENVVIGVRDPTGT